MINIVLFEPEIPFNTANIIRTCVAGNCKLHIIKPIGFDLTKDHKDLKRGSTNFLNEVDLTLYENFSEFEKQLNNNKLHILTRYGKETYDKIEYNQDIFTNQETYIMFGKESSGVTEEILEKFQDTTFRIPMDTKMRSLNLSNCVALVTYHLLQKSNYIGLALTEPQ